MSDQERSDEEIRALCDAATPGPWETRQTDDGRFYGQPPTFDVVTLDGGREELVVCGGPAEAGGPNLGAAEGPDAEFIAAARELVPSLLAEVRSLRGVVQAVEAQRDALVESMWQVIDQHTEGTQYGHCRCGQSWRYAGPGVEPAGCRIRRSLLAALAAAADAPQPEPATCDHGRTEPHDYQGPPPITGNDVWHCIGPSPAVLPRKEEQR